MENVTGKMLENNVRLLKAMNEVILAMNDEGAYDWWILVVPDEAYDEDFEFIGADADEMDHVCKLFRRIVGRFGKYGWCTYVSGEGPLKAFGEDKEEDDGVE